MAFVLLKDDELKLLPDNQREQYHKELELYRQRERFVEQLEALENASILPYEARISPIAVIENISVKPFAREKYAANNKVQKVNVNLGFTTFAPLANIRPNLPQLSEPGVPNIKSMQEIDVAKFVLPQISAVVLNEYSYATLELPAVSLPVSIDADEAKAIKEYVPAEIYDPDIQQHKEIASVDVKYKKPELGECKLPQLASTNIDVKEFKMQVNGKPVVPQTQIAEAIQYSFEKPEYEIKPPKSMPKPRLTTRSFEKIARVEVNLPKNAGFDYKPKEFFAIEFPTAALPATNIETTFIHDYTIVAPTISKLPRINITEFLDFGITDKFLSSLAMDKTAKEELYEE